MLNAQQTVNDLIVNIDMTDIQYSVDKMMSAAEELGFDVEDFDKLHKNLKNSKCNSGTCSVDLKRIKTIDNTINKLKCHPVIKDKVVPKV